MNHQKGSVMASEKERVSKAFRTMKGLGIDAETVRPVLKRLVKLYNGDWTLIEEDNFRNLADAIFEAADEDKLKVEDSAEGEPPCKKARIGHSEDQSSSKLVGEKDNGDLGEEGEPARSTSERMLEESSQSFPGDPTIVSDQSARHAVRTNRGPIGVSQNPLKKKKDNGSCSTHNHPATFQMIQDIGSSTRGLVKVSLTCHRSIEKEHNFHHPNAQELINSIEAKYRKFYSNSTAQFSMVKMLNELCESYLETGDDSVNRPHPNKSSQSSSHPSLGSKIESIMTNNLVHDITNGTEKVPISLLKESANDAVPRFTYIPDNIVYQSAYVHVSLARISEDDCCSDCRGNCLSSSIPCACARDTGGDFAYTPEGLLNERFLKSCISTKQEPEGDHVVYCQDCPLDRAIDENKPGKCRGHLLRKFIKECWRKCGCTMQCANRVVQRGITRKIQVFRTSEGKGWGVRTLEKLPAGAFICEYSGEILTNIELYERNKKQSGKDGHVYPVLLDADWATEAVLKDEDALCLDATYYGNVARFMNHRCFDGNMVEIPVQVETADRHYYHLAFFTKREVDALEELTWDYGIDFDDDNHPIKAFQCRCGSEHCRDKKIRR